MYNTITPERFAIISFVFIVVLIAGVVCAGFSQENKHPKKQEEQGEEMKTRKFKVAIDGVTYSIKCNDIVRDNCGVTVRICGESDKTIFSKIKDEIQNLVDKHGEWRFSVTEKVFVGFKFRGEATKMEYIKTKSCEELEKMFGN